MTNEFYIGWDDQAPPGLARYLKRWVMSLVFGLLALASALAVSQQMIGRSSFEWGMIKEFKGVIRMEPYPHLLVARPGTSPRQFSSYYLVKRYKFGFNPAEIRRFDGRDVSLKGTLIYRENRTMIEVIGDSIRPAHDRHDGEGMPQSPPAKLGHQKLVGEIVDSKCYLGVMNPGEGIPHRACAIRCVSGGIPPLLRVRQPRGPTQYFLLVAGDGGPVNQQVLPFIGEPVAISGEVFQQGDWLILKADPTTYERVSRTDSETN